MSQEAPFQRSEALGALRTKHFDLVVIGGGIIGVMAAWHLAERGLSVTVCEKGRIAGEQSSRNWGWPTTSRSDASRTSCA